MSRSFLSQRGASGSVASVLKVAGVAVLVLGLLFALAACGGKATLVGKWTNPDEAGTMEFTSDGKVILSGTGSDGTLDYKVDGNKLTLSLMGMDIMTINYKLDGDTLSMDDPEGSGDTLVLKRAK